MIRVRHESHDVASALQMHATARGTFRARRELAMTNYPARPLGGSSSVASSAKEGALAVLDRHGDILGGANGPPGGACG